MKSLITALFVTVLCLPAAAYSQHAVDTAADHAVNHAAVHAVENNETADSASGAVTVSIRQNDRALCGTAMYDKLYALTIALFAEGVEQVQLAEYEQQVFTLAVASEEFAGASAEAIIDHLKDIPRQLVEIIREDPAVLDSCSNFSVALVGPP